MWNDATEASRWWRQAENDLEFARMALREECVPFAVFHESQARPAIEAAERFVRLARNLIRTSGTEGS